MASPTRLVELIFMTPSKTKSWKDRRNSVLAWLIPRGWVYQNMVAIANHRYSAIALLDPVSQLILPGKVNAATEEIRAASAHPSPYTFMATLWLPNYNKAVQMTARNQTMVNQALLACALERCRLARGAYPETLDALAPQFIAAIPHGVIDGQPFHYRRTADGTFILYSIGWDERDHGGVPGKTSAEGDWVWPVFP
jgi:hypothetical protein